MINFYMFYNSLVYLNAKADNTKLKIGFAKGKFPLLYVIYKTTIIHAVIQVYYNNVV